MPVLNNILLWVLRKLYPNGRAWWMPLPVQTGGYIVDEDGNNVTDEDGNFLVTEDYSVSGGFWYRLHRALSIQFAIAYQAALGTQDFQLPDNPNFTIYDARQWYRRLGLFDSGSVSLDDMKAAINAWWSNYNATIRNKQNYLFIQGQLQASGFSVNVYENRFTDGMGGWITKTPEDILGPTSEAAYLGGFYLGESYLGEDFYGTKIMQYIEESIDDDAIFTNLRSTFYIADPSGITNFATIPVARKTEFRQLLIKLKPLHTEGYLFVNYT